jgi:hypothetical protein
MNKEFIPYEQALELKELGFKKDNDFGLLYKGKDIPAILYQQAFRFFRDKYELSSWIYNSDLKKYFFTILQNGRIIKAHEELLTYEEAELACLKKLIEIVKNK